MFYKLMNAYTRQFSFPYRGLKYFLRVAKWLNIADKIYTKKLPGNFFMLVNPGEHLEQQLFWYGYFEKEIGDLIGKILRSGDVFLDIGANIGYFSLLAAIKEPTCKVVAFEPRSDVYDKLQKNISINHVTNIIIVNAAVGEISEEKELYLSAGNNMGMSSFKQPENFSGETEMVKVLSIDDWLKTSGLHKTDVVKIDVEGNEMNVLKGMKDALIKFKPLLIIEVNPQTLSMFNIKAADIFDYLNKLGFNGFTISENAELPREESIEIDQTKNLLFIHQSKKTLYDHIWNE